MSQTPRLLFRADAGHALGLGHFSRMRSLAAAFEALGPCEAVFAVNDLELARAFLGASAHVIGVDSLDGLCAQDVTVVDLPGLPLKALDPLRRLGGLLVGVDDEAPGPFSFDVLIRPTPLPGPEPDNGPGAVWRGGQYVVLHPKFARHPGRARALPPRAARLLVCFGGGDPAGLTLWSLPTLNALPPDVTVHVVAGAAFTEADALLRLAAGNPRLRVDIALTDMVEAFAQADAALISGGTLLYEACAMGVPAAIVPQNREQNTEADFFASSGAAISLGLSPTIRDMERALDRLLTDAVLRAGLSAAGRALVSPDGADRIARNLLARKGEARP